MLEIDVDIIVGVNKNGKEISGPKYGDLHNRIEMLRKKIQKYYDENIIDDLFKYELLK